DGARMKDVAGSKFATDFEDKVDAMRAALARLFADLGVDPSKPQDMARRFQLNKTLTWKLSRLLQGESDLDALAHVPGAGAMRLFTRAVEADGASPGAVRAVVEASEGFERLVEFHVGDRQTLELILDGLGSKAAERLETSRKLAFRGNSGLWGVQAKARVLMCVLAPNAAAPETLDLATIRGYVGFRRLRPSVRWPLFRIRDWSTGDDAITTNPVWEPIEESDDGTFLIRSFSSEVLPEIRTVTTATGSDVVLMPGPVGNTGAFTCFQGEMMRGAVSRYRDRHSKVGELGSSITAPTEQLVVDLAVHEDLDFALQARAEVVGSLTPHGTPEDELVLPIHEEVREVPGRPPALGLPDMRRYDALFESVCRRMGADVSKMRAVRLEMKYPPLGSSVMLRFDLPERP
ncbi:MAG: hypothetical protein KDA28_11780, partial [Phycisphaerales bacterium]|nr:hypothetical protein [Phycisphaerales bacterium]